MAVSKGRAVALAVLAGVAWWAYQRRETLAGWGELLSSAGPGELVSDAVGGFIEVANGIVLKLDKRFNGAAWGNMRALMPVIEQVRRDKNVRAFLMVIRHRESSKANDAYTLMNGGKHFAAPPWVHPCKKYPGGVSSAAGAYQFVCATWKGIVEETGLKDFRPENQERAALYHMAWLGALPDVIAGRFVDAVAKCNKNSGWTSLPGGSEQLQTMDEARGIFVQYGGKPVQ